MDTVSIDSRSLYSLLGSAGAGALRPFLEGERPLAPRVIAEWSRDSHAGRAERHSWAPAG